MLGLEISAGPGEPRPMGFTPVFSDFFIWFINIKEYCSFFGLIDKRHPKGQQFPLGLFLGNFWWITFRCQLAVEEGRFMCHYVKYIYNLN